MIVDLFVVKLLFAVVIAGIGLFGTWLPWRLGARGTNQRRLALSDTFAAGVLGGAGLIHLLGDGMGAFEAALPHVSYPLAPLLAGAGFLLILLIEAVVVPGHPGHDETALIDGTAGLRHEADAHPESTSVYPVILLAVLSVHSVILGLALGAQSAFAGAAVVFLAIVAHKAAAGVALGVGFERQGLTYRRALPRLSFFSVMTPAGIVLGAVLGEILSDQAGQVFEAVFDSVGAGTFLYIAALDIINTEFGDPGDHGRKWTTAALGFGLMAVIALWM